VEADGDPALTAVLSRALAVVPGAGDATLTHPFHGYPARLHPATARALLEGLATPGCALLDPFCGSGTVLVEGVTLGLRVRGRDLSPLAVELAGMKCRVTRREEREALLREASRVSARARDALRAGQRFWYPPAEEGWYAPGTLAELAGLWAFSARAPTSLEGALRMLFSSVLVKVSRQASETDPRRVTKELPPGAALRLYAARAKELVEGLRALAEAVPRGTPAAEVAVDDATTLATVGDGAAELVVTSPPYANTYDYVDHHARRYPWLGLDPGGLVRGELGAARWFADPEAGARRFREGVSRWLSAMARVLRPGGRCVVVLADGAAGGRALRADALVTELGAAQGLPVRAWASQARAAYDPDSARAFRAAPRREHVMVLTRV
jgi:SAM-dependent methyltransferase